MPLYKSQNISQFEPYHDHFFDFSQTFYDASSYGSTFKKVIFNDGFNLNQNHGVLVGYVKFNTVGQFDIMSHATMGHLRNYAKYHGMKSLTLNFMKRMEKKLTWY